MEKREYSLTSIKDLLEVADILKDFIEQNKLATEVQGKNFPQVEAWQFAGLQFGLVAQADDLKDISVTNDKGEREIKYQASVEIMDLKTNYVVGKGFAVCSNKEQGKKFYQEYAIASMAQTRAIGKGFRILLSVIIKMAGYEPTPSEEMDGYDTNRSAQERDDTPREKTVVKKRTEPAPPTTPLKQPEPTAPAEGYKDGGAGYASAKQKEEIIRLVNYAVITREEKTKMLLNINKLDEDRAKQSIAKLKTTIKERSGEEA